MECGNFGAKTGTDSASNNLRCASRFPGADTPANRGAASKAPRFICHRQRFGAFRSAAHLSATVELPAPTVAGRGRPALQKGCAGRVDPARRHRRTYSYILERCGSGKRSRVSATFRLVFVGNSCRIKDPRHPKNTSRRRWIFGWWSACECVARSWSRNHRFLAALLW